MARLACQPGLVIFGDSFDVPVRPQDAQWIAAACRGRWGTVGALVPNDFAAYARLEAPSADVADWWSAYRALFAAVADVGARHSSTPGAAWFAVWEGHGWTTSTTLYARQGPLDRAGRRALRAEQRRLRDDDLRRNARIREGLAEVPRLELTHRTHYLVSGPVSAVTALREPGAPDRWQRPDLFWPDDRQWFVATDVDFWSLYVGGSDGFIGELAAAIPTGSNAVTLDQHLVPED